VQKKVGRKASQCHEVSLSTIQKLEILAQLLVVSVEYLVGVTDKRK